MAVRSRGSGRLPFLRRPLAVPLQLGWFRKFVLPLACKAYSLVGCASLCCHLPAKRQEMMISMWYCFSDRCFPRWRSSSITFCGRGSCDGRRVMEDCNPCICDYFSHHIVAAWRIRAVFVSLSKGFMFHVQIVYASLSQLRGCRIAGWVSAKATCCLCVLLPPAIVGLTTVTVRNDKTARLCCSSNQGAVEA